MNPAAVLFDMDGTLVDTERLWWDATSAVADVLGRALTAEDEPAVTGRPVAYTAEYLRSTSDTALALGALETRLERAFAARVRDRIVPRPGALALLESLAEKGVPAAVVSASPRSIVDLVANALGSGLFSTTVAVEDTVRSKPAPDPYELAASLLDVDPAACVAVEDTEVGVAAAMAAGCFVLAVPSDGQQIIASPRTELRDSLLGLDVSDLAALLK